MLREEKGVDGCKTCSARYFSGKRRHPSVNECFKFALNIAHPQWNTEERSMKTMKLDHYSMKQSRNG